MSLLKIDNISYSYHNLEGETHALTNVSFEVLNGEILIKMLLSDLKYKISYMKIVICKLTNY